MSRKNPAKSRFAQALYHLDKSLGCIQDLIELFGPAHEDYQKSLEAWGAVIIAVQEHGMSIWNVAWPNTSQNYRSYLGGSRVRAKDLKSKQ